MHALAPEVDEYLPDAQIVQAVEPVVAAMYPAVQVVQ